MRLIKMLGLAAVMALAAMAFVGVGSASAVEQKTVLCEEEPNGAGECEGGLYTGELTASSAAANLTVEILGVEVEITCTSAVEGEITAEKGQPQLPGTMTALSFTVCMDSLGRTCTVGNGVQLPYEALLSQDKANPGDGKMIVAETGSNGQPGATVVCQDANPFTPDVNCTYKANESNSQFPGKEVVNLQVEGGEEPKVVAAGVTFKEVGSKCTGSNPGWTATYDVTPENLWVAHVVQ